MGLSEYLLCHSFRDLKVLDRENALFALLLFS